MPNSGKKRAPGTGAKTPTGNFLIPVASVDSLARIPNIAAGEVARDGDVVRVTGVPYLAHGVLVPATEIYFDGEVRPKQAGPWLGEADKVAWRDPATGYQCIILRARPGGFLGGYVGVPSDHPLHEFAADAIPGDLGVEVHGGVTYAATSIDPVERMPVRRIVWSASFWDAKTRDDLFAWLAERVHRWDDWGEIRREHLLRHGVRHLDRLGSMDGQVSSELQVKPSFDRTRPRVGAETWPSSRCDLLAFRSIGCCRFSGPLAPRRRARCQWRAEPYRR